MSGRVTYGEFDLLNPDGSITFYESEEDREARLKAERKAEFEAKAQELTIQWLHGVVTKESYEEQLMELTREYYGTD